LSQDHIAFLQDLDRVAEPTRTSPHWLEHLAQSNNFEQQQHEKLIKQAEWASASLQAPPVDADTGVKIWNGPSADKEKPSLRLQPIVDASHLEQDFTTAGTPSKLGCPFASSSTRQSPLVTPRSSSSRMSSRGRRSKRPSFCDPIRAEICGNNVSASASVSIEGSGAVCPIRFLDQHAPEDVAKYFEKHKHELPRSHEACIGRFQSNTESIQQLDQKYGNLVSMIQGLGEKHQAWLPEDPEDAEDDPEDTSKADVKVEKWATAVTSSLQNSTPPGEESPEMMPDEARTTHFDRPMKEIRVGESPSRPWGIKIPVKYTNADSSSSVGSAPTASPPLPLEMDKPLGETPKKPGKCPFGTLVKNDGSEVKEHDPAVGATREANTEAPVSTLEQFETEPAPEPEKAEQKAEQTSPNLEAPRAIPQMIFNGPVFFGYPPDQLATFLQNSNFGGTGR
jgi:hypothetical protein